MVFSNKFICKGKDINKMEKNVPAPYLRRTFNIDNSFSKAEITLCGLGFYKIYINGKDISKGAICSSIYNPNDILFYDNYDLTKYLKRGKNVLSFVLGNGLNNSLDAFIWNFEDAVWVSSPKIALALEIDGKLIFEGDNKFVCADSPITFDDLRCGTHYDSTKEIKDWNKIDFDDSKWTKAKKADTPKGIATLSNTEPVIIEKRIKPISVTKLDNGHYIYDFGEDNTGVCQLNIKGEKGQKIIFTHAECLNPQGELYWQSMVNGEFHELKYHKGGVQQDEFICSGKHDTFIPQFTYHGFRYVDIYGITDKQATKSLLTYLVMHADIKSAGSFWCDDYMINAIQQCTLRSNLSNMVFVPTDCPHREKNGWTGDATLSAEQFMYNHKPQRFLREWLKQILLAQNEEGTFPGIVPSAGWGFAWGNGPLWDEIVIEIAYRIYITTNDITVLQQVNDSWKRYINYMDTKRNEKGLFAYGLGDWAEAGKNWAIDIKSPLEVCDTLRCLYIYELSEKIFNLIGESDYANKCNQERLKTIKAFRDAWVENGYIVKCHAISGQAMAISYGVFTEKERKDAVEYLVKLINEDEIGFRVGVMGGRVLFEVLSENGYSELAYKLITKKDFGGYGYCIAHGATTLPEVFELYIGDSYIRQDGYKTSSLNHHFWGFVSTWFYKYLAGINIVDFKTAVIKPYFIDEVNKVLASHIFANGKVGIKIIKKDEFAFVTIKVKNIDCSFVCPKGYRVNGKFNIFELKNGVNKIKLVKIA